MASENKTIADVVAKMLEFADTDSQTIGRDVLRRRIQNFARRFEAAAKREREAGAEEAQICGEIGELIGREAACKEKVTDCNGLGNAAKMREEFENIAEYAKSANCHTEDSVMLEYLNQIEEWAESALAAPPRNCDRFTTLDDARNAFFEDYVPDETCSSANAFAIWLFDEAKGESEVEK